MRLKKVEHQKIVGKYKKTNCENLRRRKKNKNARTNQMPTKTIVLQKVKTSTYTKKKEKK